jgi:DNA ligase-1
MGDAAWAIYLLTGNRVRRVAGSSMLKEFAVMLSGYQPWLVDQCYRVVGDWAETTSLIVPEGLESAGWALQEAIEDRLLPLRDLNETDLGAALAETWRCLNIAERIIFNRLIAGRSPAKIEFTDLTNALAALTDLNVAVIAHRLVGDWVPCVDSVQRLLAPGGEGDDLARPYPFFYARPVNSDPCRELFGPIRDWCVSWMREGARVQIIKRGGGVLLWSPREEVLNEKYADISVAAGFLPDGTVFDGVIFLAANDGAVYGAFDCLEKDGMDIRQTPFADRSAFLEEIIATLPAGGPIQASSEIAVDSWRRLRELRSERGSADAGEWFLKSKIGVYRSGKSDQEWWSWKLDTATADVVLLYAHLGANRRSGDRVEYTFAVWKGESLIPVVRMPLPPEFRDCERTLIEHHVRDHTVERFGPVRAVRPGPVVELAFEGVVKSSRRKAGLILRSPRIVRLRNEKHPEEADSLESLRDLMGV